MANYNSLKNAGLLKPVANTDLGSPTNTYGNLYMSGNVSLNGTLLNSSNAIAPRIASIAYLGDDTAANSAGGTTVTLTGSGFIGSSVYVGGTIAGSVSVVSSTQITFVAPVKAAGNYSLSVVNSDGATATFVPGIQYSGVPSWSTTAGSLATVYETSTIANTFSATSDNFTVRASDGENQDTDRNFSYTINPDVVTWSSPAEGATLTGTQDTAFSQELSATSAAGKTISYSANALPSGLSISGSSITGTPTVGYSSSSLITATAATTNKTATRTFNWNIQAPTYTITPASSSVNEGSALTFNVGGTNITNGTYYWSINNISTAAGDFSASTGSFTITSNAGSFNVTATADVTTEGAQTFTVSLRTGSVSGTIVATSSTVTINDTSLTLWSPISGKLFTWGRNDYGQMGIGVTGGGLSPTQVGALSTWVKIDGGNTRTAGFKNDGTMWTWGTYADQVSGSWIDRSSPVQVGTETNWRDMAAGTFHTLGVKDTGTLWGWGVQQQGEIVNPGQFPLPQQIGTLTNWSSVGAASYSSAAIKTDGTLWTWGQNDFGQLGLGTTINISSPQQVGALTNWYQVSVGSSKYMMALKTNGTLWAWGNGAWGQLGLGSGTNVTSPVQIGALTNWSSISAGGYTSAAINTSNALWVWGINNYGGLGQGDTISRSSPVQVGTDYSKVAANFSRIAAIKTNGTLWAWGIGDNGGGGVGDGTSLNRFSPTQIGALTTWLNVYSPENTNGAIRS